MLQPLPASTALIDLAHERIVAAIVDGTLQPGQRVRQDELAALLGVSRQPVSHALQLVKRQGLVVEHGRKGLAVAPVEADRVRDLYRVRAALDALSARLAAERPREEVARARTEAEAALEAGLGLPDEATTGMLIRADATFHSALYRLAGNAAIEEIIAPQWPHFMRSMGAVLRDVGRRPRYWQEHAVILGHIMAGRPEEAAEAARGHAERAGAEVAARIEEAGTVAA